MNSYKYINKILTSHAAPFYAKRILKYNNTVFMQDGTKYCILKATLQHFKDLKIQVLPWPVQSPNLNPIKHLQRIMKLWISKKCYLINNLQEMEAVLQEEWDKLTPTNWKACIKSIKRRYKLVIKAKGGSIKYQGFTTPKYSLDINLLYI